MTVMNMRGRGLRKDAVRVDRTTRWGNRYIIGRDGDRDEVIARYKVQLWKDIQAGTVTLEDLADLYMKDLACWCAPQACHADVLVAAAQYAYITLARIEEDESQHHMGEHSYDTPCDAECVHDQDASYHGFDAAAWPTQAWAGEDYAPRPHYNAIADETYNYTLAEDDAYDAETGQGDAT